MNKQHTIGYFSSYDRGLKHLLLMWQEVLNEYPDAQLHICYGWDLFNIAHSNNPERMKWRDALQALMEQKGIHHHGRVGKKQLQEIRSKCGIWSYPTDFDEINCHPAGTFIETENGDAPIEKLTLSDAVRTIDGTYRNVTSIRSRIHRGKMIRINPQCGESFEVTPEHPVLAIKSTKNDTSRNLKSIIKNKPVWIEAKDIEKYDILLSSMLLEPCKFKMNFEDYKGAKTNHFKTDNIELIDNGDWKTVAWWFGYFLGDGNANSRGKISCLVADEHYHRDYEKVKKGFESFGLAVRERKLRGCIELYAHSYTFSRYLKDKFYDKNNNKTCPRDLLTTGGSELLDGLMKSDGSMNANYRGSGIQRTFTNKSRKLISQIRTLLMSMGIATKIHTRKHSTGGVSYYLSWVEYKDKKLNFYTNDTTYVYRKVGSVEKRDYEGLVYNIDVDTNNTYHCNGYIVHNCITALDVQKDGLVPVVINKAALQETVQSGVKVEGDIYNPEVAKTYLRELLDMMGDKTRWEQESEKAKAFAKDYDWDKIADKWAEEFETLIDNPLVSIVTPTIREGWWELMANNLSESKYKNFEWVIVDDHKDNREDTAKMIANKYNLDIKYVRGAGSLPKANNIAMNTVGGELLVWLQDFILIPDTAIGDLVQIYKRNPNALIAPVDEYWMTTPPNFENKISWFDNKNPTTTLSWKNIRQQYRGLRTTDNPMDFELNFGSLPTRVLKDLGGWHEEWDEKMGYDNTEIALRALMAGYEILVDDSIVAKCLEIKGKTQDSVGTTPEIWDEFCYKLKSGEIPLKIDN